jgi:N-acetylneuraminic acid mutarotase
MRMAIMMMLTATASPAAEWPPMPEAFSSFGAITCDGYIYVYGGHAAKTHSYSTETTLGKFRRLNIANPQSGWEELPGGVACQGLSLIAHHGKLYRLGGMRPRNAPGEKPDQVSLATCQAFDPKTKTWSDLPKLPAPRSSFDAVVIGNTIFIVGGWEMKGEGKSQVWADNALLLDLSKEKPEWVSVPAPFKRRALTCVALGEKVYVVGGLTPEGEAVRTVSIFDFATKTWSEGPPLPEPDKNGFSAATCVEGGAIYANPADGNIYRLSKDNKNWEKVAAVQHARIVHRMLGTGDGRLVVIGGASSKRNISETEIIELK